MSAHHDRAFLLGDASHTHSPQAGQGYVALVGWARSRAQHERQHDGRLQSRLCVRYGADELTRSGKLAGVLRGELKPEILATYQLERHQIARELIEFDHKVLSRHFECTDRRSSAASSRAAPRRASPTRRASRSSSFRRTGSSSVRHGRR